MTLAAQYLGETTTMKERLIVAPAVGVFRLTAVAFRGAFIDEGQCIGIICSTGRDREVLSAFSGQLMGVLASDGERVRPGQPIAWMLCG